MLFYWDGIPGNPKEPSYPWKGRENHIKFNLASIPSMESVTGAELRIPFVITVLSDDSEKVNSESFRESSMHTNSIDDSPLLQGANKEEQKHEELKAVRILLHDVMRPATSPRSKKPKETHLLEPISYPIDSKTVVLSKRRNGTSAFWLTFDVFPAVSRWMSNPKKNHGLVLEILGVTNEGHTVPQETVVQRHNLRVKRDVDDDEQNSVDSNVENSNTLSSSTSDARTSGKSSNSITTESSSSSSSSLSTTTSATRSSSKTTQDSGESFSSSMAETPTSSSPTEVGVAVATDDGFINSNNE